MCGEVSSCLTRHFPTNLRRDSPTAMGLTPFSGLRSGVKPPPAKNGAMSRVASPEARRLTVEVRAFRALVANIGDLQVTASLMCWGDNREAPGGLGLLILIPAPICSEAGLNTHNYGHLCAQMNMIKLLQCP